MKTNYLKQLSILMLLLTFTWTPASAAEYAATVKVNGEVVARKIADLYLTKTNDNGLRINSTAPRVALVYAKASPEDAWEIDYIHPVVCQVVFGETQTAVNDLMLYEIQKLDADDLRINGLREGETVRVYNTAGRLCLTTRATANGAVVGIKSLPRDLYIIQAGKTTFKYMNRK